MSEYFSNTDWLNARLGRFTASEIHKLFVSGKKGEYFGQGAMTYIRQKVAEEITQTTKDQVESRSTEWGYMNELDASIMFQERTGLKGVTYGIGQPKFFEYGDHAGVSPDWEGDKIGADFKCPYNSDVHLENLFITTQEQFKKDRWEYYCQAQMGMKIREWGAFYFCSYDPRMPSDLKLSVLQILPDAGWQKEFEERLEKAIEKKNELLGKLIERPSIIMATHDPSLNTTIVSAA